VLSQPPATHMADNAPPLLNVLRVCDIPEAVGLLAPRPVTLLGETSAFSGKSTEIYRAAGAVDRFSPHR